jgi:hypothetical protein
MMGTFSFGYLLLLPAYILVALCYNLFVRPKQYKNWERKFMCQRCGAVLEPEALAADGATR